MSRPSHNTSSILRAVAVGWLCLATPAVQAIVMSAVSFAAGIEVCADGCDDADTPCTQQCGHCLCSMHVGLVPEAKVGLSSSFTLLLRPLSASAAVRSGHHEPPFRPPVS